MRKRFLTLCVLLLAMVNIRIAMADPTVLVTTWAVDDSGLFNVKCDYFDDETTKITLAYIADYSNPAVKDLVFPAKVHAKFESYNKYYGGDDLEDDFSYEIGSNFFDYQANQTVETITFQEGITRVPDEFYRCEADIMSDMMDSYLMTDATVLKEVNFPASIEYIGSQAFKGHINLEKITFAGDGLTTIGDEAFRAVCEKSMGGGMGYMEENTWHSALQSVTLPSTVFSIGARAFQGNVELKSFTLSQDLGSIGDDAFANTSIEDVTLDKCNNLSVSSSPFTGCPIKKVTIVPRPVTNYVIIAPENLFAGVGSQFDVVIEEADKDFEAISFGDKCFYNSGIKSITLPQKFIRSVAYPFSISFGKQAFANTSFFKNLDLASVNCEDRVLFAQQAFQYSGLEKLTLNNRTASIGPNAFEGTKIDELVIPQYVNPNGKEDDLLIEEEAFLNTQKLQSARILSSLEDNSLYSSVFKQSALKTVELPASLESINAYAFENSGLTEFNAGENLTNVGMWAFHNCKDLKKVDFSASKVKFIRTGLFSMCEKLDDIKLAANLEFLQDQCFERTAIKEFDADATHIGQAFYDMPNLEKVSFVNKDFKFLQPNTFQNCPKLKEIDFGYIEYIYDHIIQNCPAYTDIVISPALKNIDKDAFADIKSQIKTVHFNSSEMEDLTNKANAPFAGMTFDLFFSNSLDLSGKYLFSFATITSIDLDNIKSCDEYVFEDAVIRNLVWGNQIGSPFQYAQINNLSFRDGVKKVGETDVPTFKNHKIDNIDLTGIEEIAESAFENATLTSSANKNTLVIPASVKKIGNNAFKNNKVESIRFEEGEGLEIGESAFAQTDGGSYMTITTRYGKDNIPAAGDNAFAVSGGKIDRFYAGSCDDVEAYKAANGWKDIDANIWDGITNFKYSFEIVGEKTKRPIEVYADNISLNGRHISHEGFIGCDNKALISYDIPSVCNGIEFDHWPDGTTDAMAGTTMTLTSDTVIRIYVKETTKEVNLALKNPALADKVKFLMKFEDSDEWVEQSQAFFNDCALSKLMEIKVELLDPAHYGFFAWLKNDDSNYSYSQQIPAPSTSINLFADVRVNTYPIMVEMMPEDPNYDLVDHIELNGVDKGKNFMEDIPYGEEVTLNIVGVKDEDNRYILDYWQNKYDLNIVTYDNPFVFTMGDNPMDLTPEMKVAAKYTITAKSDDEKLGTVKLTVDNEDKAKDGKIYEKATIKLEATPAGEHINFLRWNDNAGDQSTLSVRDVKALKDFEYIAYFDKDSFNIDVKIDGMADPSKVAEVSGVGRYGWGDDVTLSFVLKDDHYHFVAWMYGSSYKTDVNLNLKVEENLEVTAQFAANEYTITTAAKPAEGGTITGGGKATYGSLITLNAEPNENYNFVRWEDDEEVAAERKVLVEGDASYSAVFALKEYHVLFVDWDGSEPGGEYVPHGKSATAPEDPVREGYDFIGWRLGEKVYSPEDVNKLPVTEELTFNAEYKIKQFTVRFLNQDDELISVQKVNWNEAAIAPDAPVWEGHVFSCWDTDFQHVKADLTIKPVYDTQTFTVRFVDFDGKLISEQVVAYGKSAVAPDDPVREGFIFTGWDVPFDNIIEDITITAQYEEVIDYTPDNLTVTLEPKEGDDVLITLAWDKVDGAASYELSLFYDEVELITFNTYGQNKISNLLSVLQKEFGLKPGTYAIDWYVRSLDGEADPISIWAQGKEFQITIPDTGTDIDQIQGEQTKANSQKLLINGQIFILRGEHLFDAQGKMIK